MKQGVLKYFIILSITCLSCLFAFDLKPNNNTCNTTLQINNIAEITLIDDTNNYVADNENISEVYNANYTNLTYKNYTKGNKIVNVIINFINYANDETNHFTQSEINNIISTFNQEVQLYFDRMSQGYIDINIDYVCSVAPQSYDYYLSLSSANILTESLLFSSAISNKLDLNGNPKTFKFSEYHFKVNAFAGISGAWDTFLWPHAFSYSSLILMMEYKQNLQSPMASSTMCHEMLHTFGVMDLYAYTGASQNFGAQQLDMMATSSKNTSTNAYFRNKIGWIGSSIYDDNNTTPIEEIPSRQRGSLTLDLYPNCTTDYTKTIAYKFGENSDNDEFFMIEYKIKNYGNLFDSIIPATSVVIYRVNLNATNGNSNGNYPNSYNEIIFMGNTSYDITTSDYTSSCTLTEGSIYGNKGALNTTSLVYSSNGGKENLFNGVNSDIVVKVNSLNNTRASITLTFKYEKETLNLSNTTWNYSSPFTYNGTTHGIQINNIPNNIQINYTGPLTAKNVGKYTVTANLIYDRYFYDLINNTFPKILEWEIIPAALTISVDSKTSKYGEPLQELTYSISQGTIYSGDNLNIQLTKDSGINVGTYNINCSSNNSNYNITTIPNTYIITPRIIKINIFDQSLLVNEFNNFDSSKYEILEDSDSILEGENLNISLKPIGFNSVTAGEYTIDAVSNNSNYYLIVDYGILTISSDSIQNISQGKTSKPITVFWICIISISVISTSLTILIIKRRRKRLDRWQRYLFT